MRGTPTLITTLLVALLPVAALAKQPVTPDFSALRTTTPDLAVCEGPAPKVTKAPWHHTKNALLTRAAHPRHMAEDAYATPGARVALRAKFTYGRASKDLEEEDIEVRIHDCKRWALVGQAVTSADGWATVEVKAPPKPGVYAVSYGARGDRTQVWGRLWVLPRGRRVVVLDIDGTLTTDDEQIKDEVLQDQFRQIGSGKHDPKYWPGAVELTQAIAKRGDVLVYLSGRPYWLIEHSRHWLDQHHFAPGMLLHTRTPSQVLTTVDGVGTFKRDQIAGLKAAGFDVVEAYGNAATDVWAYRNAGIPPSATWIIGPLEDKGGAHAVSGGWSKVVSGIRGRSQPTTQPSQKSSSAHAP